MWTLIFRVKVEGFVHHCPMTSVPYKNETLPGLETNVGKEHDPRRNYISSQNEFGTTNL